jgi:hypothetical protein
MLIRKYLVLIIIITSFITFSANGQIKNEIPAPHSPSRATAYSAILPGLGQIYNKQAWKTTIIYGAEAVVTYFAITNYKGASRLKEEYLNKTNGRPVSSSYTNYSAESLLNLHNAYEKNFELSLIIGGVVYLLNIVDALVYAHLFSFDISDNLSATISPIYIPSAFSSPSHSTFGVSFSFSIKH